MPWSICTTSKVCIQGDQLNKGRLFLVPCDLSSVRYFAVAFISVTFYKLLEHHGHVFLVGL